MENEDITFGSLKTWIDDSAKRGSVGLIKSTPKSIQARGPVGSHAHEIHEDHTVLAGKNFETMSPKLRGKYLSHFDPHVYSPTYGNGVNRSENLILIKGKQYLAVYSTSIFGTKECTGVFGVGNLILTATLEMKYVLALIEQNEVLKLLNQQMPHGVLWDILIAFGILETPTMTISYKIKEFVNNIAGQYGVTANLVLHLSDKDLLEIDAPVPFRRSLDDINQGFLGKSLSDSLKVYEAMYRAEIEVGLLIISGGTGGGIEAIAGSVGKKVVRNTAASVAKKVTNRLMRKIIVEMAVTVTGAVAKATFAASKEFLKGAVLLESKISKKVLIKLSHSKGDSKGIPIVLTPEEIEGIYMEIFVSTSATFVSTLVTAMLGKAINNMVARDSRLPSVVSKLSFKERLKESMKKDMEKRFLSLISTDLVMAYIAAISTAIISATKDGVWNSSEYHKTLGEEFAKQIRLTVTEKIKDTVKSPWDFTINNVASEVSSGL